MDHYRNTLKRVGVVKARQLYWESLSLKREGTLLLYVEFIHEKGVDTAASGKEESKSNHFYTAWGLPALVHLNLSTVFVSDAEVSVFISVTLCIAFKCFSWCLFWFNGFHVNSLWRPAHCIRISTLPTSAEYEVPSGLRTNESCSVKVHEYGIEKPSSVALNLPNATNL